MNIQLEAAYEIDQFLASKKLKYAIIGGVAIQRWGAVRLTSDVDITILISFGQEEKLIAELIQAFSPIRKDAIEFAKRNRLVSVKASNGCKIDISLGVPGYEEEVVSRAVDYDIGDGRKVKLCSAEDLIIHKAIAGRPQDCSDIEGIILRQGKRLDTKYVLRWLEDFAAVLESEEVLERFTKPWNQFVKEN